MPIMQARTDAALAELIACLAMQLPHHTHLVARARWTRWSATRPSLEQS